MKALSKLVLLLLLVIAPALGTFADARAAESCHKINAKGVGQQVSDTETTATILGGGLLHGTTYGDFSGSIPDYSNYPPIIAFSEGTITFTTNRGTLTVTVAGTMEFTLTGQMIFIGEGAVTDAAGKLAGATGNLHFDAVEDMTTGSFVETVTGNICVRGHDHRQLRRDGDREHLHRHGALTLAK